ncbi:unnamed protein product [Cladocopium goreaui]|uniref:Uncharacterized protein n=1 Tax=Cladocopium goreaui TaxID=2562237 RepID=A0A9P1FI77_9DINO|nr:unnamed protein product [Cladocopium goreaui]|mmetsp:Transcript_16510/g.36503  ORF Transcript_16510/g.36503 Transcript_16510/m.36503 type:complete len:478 (+) Transcript_16510:35-1468(+)
MRRVLSLRHAFWPTRKLPLPGSEGQKQILKTLEADVWPVLAISILSLSGLSALLYARRSKEEPAIKARLFSRDLEYLCEGGSNLLCRAKPDAYILHFKKDASGLTHNDFDRQRRMQQFLCKVFPQLCISIPKILSIPASDIRTLDAHLLAARSKAVRKQRLDIGSDIRVQVLQKEDLFNACLSLEICPGCGLQEDEKMPSRNSMAYAVSHGHRMAGDLNLQLFSGAAVECSAAIAAALEAHYFHAQFFAGDGAYLGAMDAKRGHGVQDALQGADLSIPQLSQMAGRALQPILPPLRRLQAMACGDSEKYAPQLLQKLQEAPEAGSVLDELKDAVGNPERLEMALGKELQRARGATDAAVVEQQEREALKLLSLSKWKARQVEEAKCWLLRFLVGRAAFQAKVLFNFMQESRHERTNQSLAEQRFLRASELLPDEGWTTGWWVRATLVGMELNIDEIERSSSELETLIAHYTEVASAS